ncbi:hypothetical protein M404DRAFT_337064 [Pisolithus tinctorius Marx 270]|uniref:Uncharacterized protein n=1 Tax=Pisolithus tinctorius Marx 270 TaxID=870435 RepID=A0A0C3NHM9_PISTI|nr:hypothetical protein M404DRAFT_337064 [Pisolithus tinctorius Marx 270]
MWIPCTRWENNLYCATRGIPLPLSLEIRVAKGNTGYERDKYDTKLHAIYIYQMPNIRGPVPGTALGTPILQRIFADFRTLVGHCLLTRESLDVGESSYETILSKFVRGLTSIVVSPVGLLCWRDCSVGRDPAIWHPPVPLGRFHVWTWAFREEDMHLKIDRQ